MSVETDGEVDGLAAPVQVSAASVFHRVYALFYNKSVGLTLIILTGVLTLVGVLARQMPDSVRLDPAARAGWLEQLSSVYGGWTGVLDAIGFFHIFSSPLYLSVTALLALSIIACTTHRLPVLYRNAYRPHTHVRPSFYRHARLAASFEVAARVDRARGLVADALRRNGYRVIEDPSGEGLYADKFHWAPFGTAAAHAGYVVVMAGFLISALTGFRIENFDLTIGIPREVGHGTGITATAESFADSYDQEWGTPIDYVTGLTVTRGGETVTQDVRVNSPLILDDVYFHQASFGVSAVVRIAAGGEVLFDDGVPLTWRSPDQSRQYGVALVDGREVYVIAAASGANVAGLAPGQVQVEAYREGTEELLGSEVVDAGGQVAIDGLTIDFVREQKYTSMIVKRDPGSWVVWVGCALLIVGTCLTMGLPHRRQWVRIVADGEGARVETATADRPDTGRRRIFDQAVDAMRTAAQEGTRT